MKILVGIVIIIIVFAVIGSVFEWIIDNIVPIVILVAAITGCIFVPRVAIPIIAVGLLLYYIQKWYSKSKRPRISSHPVEFTDTDEILRHMDHKDVEHQITSKKDSLPDEVKEIIEKGNEYICSLHKYNEAIQHNSVSEQLYEMEKTVCAIVSEIENHPEKASEAKRLFNYYLPTINKIMKKYAYYEKKEISTEYANETKDEIQKNMEMMNEILREFQNKMYLTDNFDISSELSVMRKMMEQDGIVM